MWVVAGDAGGMYEVLLDKDTFKCQFAYANPVYNALCWHPFASVGEFDVFAGVPVCGQSTTAAAIAVGLESCAVGYLMEGPKKRHFLYRPLA